jgi:hypothetical protein
MYISISLIWDYVSLCVCERVLCVYNFDAAAWRW